MGLALGVIHIEEKEKNRSNFGVYANAEPFLCVPWKSGEQGGGAKGGGGAG